MDEKVIKCIEDKMNCTVLSTALLGSGATADVCKAEISAEPYIVAVKHSRNALLLKQEYDQIKFINERIDCMLANAYHYEVFGDGSAVMIMEYFDGISVDKIKDIKKALKILHNTHGEPTLIHGDYWQPNFIADKNTYELLGVIDPFNIMWAEAEYELFTLTVGGSQELRLYENYKSKVSTGKYCDLKVEMYALYNELLWHKKLGTFNNDYLIYRANRLIKQLKKNNLK